MRRLTLPLLALALVGCQTPAPPQLVTPVSPVWVQLTRPPVVAVHTNGTFIVTDELVKRALQMDEFVKRYEKWKLENKVP